MTLAILSPTPITELAAKEAPTWLDRELERGSSSVARDTGFGREVRTALAARRQWLIEQQLADGRGQAFRLRGGAMETLRQRELENAGNRLKDSGESGPVFECPACEENAYIDFEGGCALCGEAFEWENCIVCHSRIPIEDALAGFDEGICSYCSHIAAKDD